MNILISNDDGYEAEGIKVLAKRLAKEHKVYVIAPSSNRSAVSSHITMYNPTEIKMVDERVWACSGMPADCVCVALLSNLFDFKFDVVIGGINYGANMGTDIVYSGTCSVARQAVLDGVPGIAVSCDPVDWEKAAKEGMKFEALADFVAKNLETLVSLVQFENPRMFVNVNGISADSYKGVVFAEELCIRNYGDKLEIEERDNSLVSVYKMGDNVTVRNPKSDHTLCTDGYITISRVYVDPVCSAAVDGIKFSL